MGTLAHICEEALLVPFRIPYVGRLLTFWGDLLLDVVIGPFEGL